MVHLSKKNTAMANKLGIHFPTPLPLFRAAPNIERIQEWAESQATPMLRQIAHKIREHIQYISHEDFLKQLQKTIDDFHQKIQDKPYILLVGESREYKLKKGCSDQWMVGLALEYCSLKEPVAIITDKELADYRKEHPELTHVLVLDDASYSGSQKCDLLRSMIFGGEGKIKTKELNLYFGIPFVTDKAKEYLLAYRQDFKELLFLDYSRMPVTMSMFDHKELLYIQKFNIGAIDERHTLTWFDHRFADFSSCFQPIYDGRGLLIAEMASFMNFLGYTHEPKDAKANKNFQLITNPAQYNQLIYSLLVPNYEANFDGVLIPVTISPYSVLSDESNASLVRAIISRKTGARTPYPVTNPAIEKLLATPVANSNCFFSFKKPTVTLEQQKAFDKALLLGIHKDITYKEMVQHEAQHQRVMLELISTFPLKLKKIIPNESWSSYVIRIIGEVCKAFLDAVISILNRICPAINGSSLPLS